MHSRAWLKFVIPALFMGCTTTETSGLRDGPCAPSEILRQGRDPQTHNAALRRQEFVPGQVIVKYYAGIPREFGESVLAAVLGFVPAGSEAGGQAILYSIPERDPRALSDQLKSRPEASGVIQYAEPNYRIFNLAEPLRECQCGLDTIQAEAGWANFSPVGAVVVAVTDSGVDRGHPDLKDAVLPGGDPDMDSHGSHVAGIVAGVVNNAGIAGTAGPTDKVKVLAIGFLSSDGIGDAVGGAAAIREALAEHANVILCSWGTTGYSEHLRTAVVEADAQKTLLVAAAGNDTVSIDTHPLYPASFGLANIITVMATTCGDRVAKFSNFGKANVHLSAPGAGTIPGQNILSTVLNNGYSYWRGTSMSAAFVAGAAALVSAEHPSWSAVDIKKHLLSTVDRLPVLKGKCSSGGRLNLAAALRKCGQVYVVKMSSPAGSFRTTPVRSSANR